MTSKTTLYTTDLWSYINDLGQLLAYVLNPIEYAFFSQDLDKYPQKQTKFEGIPSVGGDTPSNPP